METYFPTLNLSHKNLKHNIMLCNCLEVEHFSQSVYSMWTYQLYEVGNYRSMPSFPGEIPWQRTRNIWDQTDAYPVWLQKCLGSDLTNTVGNLEKRSKLEAYSLIIRRWLRSTYRVGFLFLGREKNRLFCHSSEDLPEPNTCSWIPIICTLLRLILGVPQVGR